jgi:hypothetical protein
MGIRIPLLRHRQDQPLMEVQRADRSRARGQYLSFG